MTLNVSRDINLVLPHEQYSNELYSLIDTNRRYLRKWLTWVEQCNDISKTKKFIAEEKKKWDANEGVSFLIKYDGKICGVVSFHRFDHKDNSSSIGYWLAEEYQGKGIMLKSCSLLISWGFDTIKLKKINISCAKANIKSQAIPKKLNFKLIKTEKNKKKLYDKYEDHNIYEITYKDWVAGTIEPFG